MKRRTPKVTENLDSLLDTMTNVVGILVIVLIVAQLGVSDAMSRIAKADDAPISESDVEQIRDELAASREQLATRREEHARAETQRPLDETRLEGRIATNDRLTDQLERQYGGKEHLATLAEEQRQLAATIRERDTALAEAQRDIRGVLQDIDALPDVPETSVRLPDPRPAPENVEVIVVMCHFERVLVRSDEALDQSLDLGLTKALGGDQRRITSNQQYEDIEKQFSEVDYGDEFFRLRVTYSRPYLLLTYDRRRETDGETRAELDNKAGPFLALVQNQSPREHYFLFYVWGDSFNAYLAARRIVEEAGFSVGWKPMSDSVELAVLLNGTGGSDSRGEID